MLVCECDRVRIGEKDDALKAKQMIQSKCSDVQVNLLSMAPVLCRYQAGMSGKRFGEKWGKSH